MTTLMRPMGITALCRKPKTSKKAPGQTIYPYLLRTLAITRSNQVWAMDISYIPMARGFVHLATVIDWRSRKVLAWRLSISMDTAFCTEAVEEAITRYGKPEIFNTDQGSQFKSRAFTGLLHGQGIRISKDGKGCWRDNVVIERVWRSIKYEVVYPHAYETVSAAAKASAATSTSTTRAGPTRAIKLELRTWRTSHRCLGLRSTQPDPAGPLINPWTLFKSAGPALRPSRCWPAS